MAEQSSRAVRQGRTLGVAIPGLAVAACVIAWSVQIIMQAYRPGGDPGELKCRPAVRQLIGAVSRARTAARREHGERQAVNSFREALGSEWTRRAEVGRACAGDAEALRMLREVDELRYAEEHAVRYEAMGLARQRRRVKRIVEQLGPE